ncbi:MAG TPA: hypothetical protein VEP90_03465 [Methylomirabilota bacterium]|nr:hypothetical protein [Methylomirabilota bacterium]
MCHDCVKLWKAVAEELYFRAAMAKDRPEHMALKGMQHSIERALESCGYKTFDRVKKVP